MKGKHAALWLGLVFAIVHSGAAPSNGAARQTLNFDRGWRFLKSDAPGADQPGFDDEHWRRLDVPHDWSIEGPFSRTNRTGGAGAFLPAGIGWYRKAFTLPASDAGRCVRVEFDGVMANSDVWINGHHVGHRPYGYVSFSYDLKGHLVFGDGRTNVLAVRVDDSMQPASRWYAGAGIYRHVRLVVTDPVHIEQWGTFVTTPRVGKIDSDVHVRNTIVNQSSSPRRVSVRVTILDPQRQPIETVESRPQMVEAAQSINIEQDLSRLKLRVWDVQEPTLYHAVIQLRDDQATLDEDEATFGVRLAQFESKTGFWLNGKNLKLYGVCLHADGSAFGMAVPLGVWERRLAELKELGVNAIRTAHNPPAPEFLDLCDRMGFLVMDEFFDCWTVGKNPYDYHLYFNEWSQIDARDTIRRDRNHPSIVLYSVGNEIHDTPKQELAKRILKGLVAVCHETDPSRPVTMALFRPNVSHDYDDGLADMLDVVGTNYRDNELLAAQRAHPDWKIIGTEQQHNRQTWLYLRDNPSHSGQFLWTGIDYLGESRRWPIVAAGSGLLDRTATPRPLAYQRQSWWSEKPMVFIARRVAPTRRAGTDPGFTPLDQPQVLFADWTPASQDSHEENVEVYSNCKDVELFLNGKSLGSKSLPKDASPRNWSVPFEPGTLKAVGRNDDKVAATYELHTAGKPARILLSADRATLAPVWDDVSYVRALVVDGKGIPVPTADDLISFKITGPGVIAAVDSADNASHEPFQASERRAFEGECFAVLKATASSGRIALTASAPGLTSASIGLLAVEAPAPQ